MGGAGLGSLPTGFLFVGGFCFWQEGEPPYPPCQGGKSRVSCQGGKIKRVAGWGGMWYYGFYNYFLFEVVLCD